MIEAWYLSMVLEGGDPSNFPPPDQGDMNIGEILINLVSRDMPGPIGIDRKPS